MAFPAFDLLPYRALASSIYVTIPTFDTRGEETGVRRAMLLIDGACPVADRASRAADWNQLDRFMQGTNPWRSFFSSRTNTAVPGLDEDLAVAAVQIEGVSEVHMHPSSLRRYYIEPFHLDDFNRQVLPHVGVAIDLTPDEVRAYIDSLKRSRDDCRRFFSSAVLNHGGKEFIPRSAWLELRRDHRELAMQWEGTAFLFTGYQYDEVESYLLFHNKADGTFRRAYTEGRPEDPDTGLTDIEVELTNRGYEELVEIVRRTDVEWLLHFQDVVVNLPSFVAELHKAVMQTSDLIVSVRWPTAAG